MIKRLPQHLINKLKAGEIVERPASIVKELIENSLDAGATQVSVMIEKGGKKLISIADNGMGVAYEDLFLTIERYATSKIEHEHDLENIGSYGFRGEALASISEVSVFRLQSKHLPQPLLEGEEREAQIGYELYRSGGEYEIKQIAFAKKHGTTVFVQDIFHHIPVREKFLKTDATERKYIKSVFLNYAMVHWDKRWELSHNGKQMFLLLPAKSLVERLLDITKSDWEKNLKILQYQDSQLELAGVVGDSTLHFGSAQYFWLFVNNRPVQDRVLKRAIMEAYKRQIVPGSYPFVCLFVDIDPSQVDVNVHPRKMEVKFLDPGSIFTRVKDSIQTVIGVEKVNYAAFRKREVPLSGGGYGASFHASKLPMTHTNIQQMKDVGTWRRDENRLFDSGSSLTPPRSLGEGSENMSIKTGEEQYMLIGQIWDMYIMLESPDSLVYIDQHALAERVAFEQMKAKISAEGFGSEVLLSPLSLEAPKDIEVESIIEQLNTIGFDVAEFPAAAGKGPKVIVYAVPAVFAQWKVDMEVLFNWVRGSVDIFVGDATPPPSPLQGTTQIVSQGESGGVREVGMKMFGLILDEMVGMKACKASIKAGQRLSMVEMKQLVEDGFRYIDGMFVCQHGRPSAVRIEKRDIDRLFDR